MTLKITAVEVNPFVDDKLKAFATITLEGCFVIRGLKIIEGHKGLFVAMPNKRRADGTFHDIAHPITAEFREHLEHEVLEAFRARLASGEETPPRGGAGSLGG